VTTYRLYDAAFESTLDLPELERSAAAPTFRVVVAPLPAVPDAWVDPWRRDEGGPWIRVQRHDGYRIRYEDQVDFHFSPADRTLTVHATDCPAATLRHFLLDQVVPLVLSVDSLVLHASANVVDGIVVAFAGPCGAGKSTLAAILERAGHAVASDDALLLRAQRDTIYAVPAYPGLRFWPPALAAVSRGADTAPVSAASTKRRLTADLRFHAHAAPLGCVYQVGAASADVTLTRLSQRDAAMLFIEHGYRLEQRDAGSLAREMDAACEAASRVPVWRLSHPRDYGAWDRVAAAIVAHARDTVARPCCS